MKVKIFFPKDHYNAQYRGHVFPLLKPFLKPDTFSDEQRRSMYGVSDKDYLIVNDIMNSDLCILTMSWNYYIISNNIDKAETFIKKCESFGKIVWIVNAFDRPLNKLKFDNILVFEPAGYHSEIDQRKIVIPVFIKDPFKIHFEQSIYLEREYKVKPTVGFCGFVLTKNFSWYKEKLKRFLSKICDSFIPNYMRSERIISSHQLRSNAISIVENSHEIYSNIILRKKYSGGASNDNDRENLKRDYFLNMMNSDYVLCIRGAGNFSVRLYETLAMGRIPVFVNTDCELPFHNQIDWKKRMVWIEENELHLLPEKILEFHQNFDKNSFIDFKKANRKFWEDNLRIATFFNNKLNP